MFRPLGTQIVGSCSKPPWLVRHEHASALGRPWWVPDASILESAIDDAVRLAVFDQERAGIDVISDGEQRRQRFDAHFFAKLNGVDATRLAEREPWQVEGRTVVQSSDPAAVADLAARRMSARVVGPVSWPGPIAVDELKFLKSVTRRPVKICVIGPLTTVGRLVDEYYRDEEALGMALAAALNEEVKALAAAGADLVQVDEPSFHSAVSRAKRWGVAALNRVIAGVTCKTAVHMCYGYARNQVSKSPSTTYADAIDLCASSNVDAISLEYEQPGHTAEILRHAGEKAVILGLLNLGSRSVETPEHVASRIREALEVIPEERLFPSSDCGMWFLPREVAFAKLCALALGAAIVRASKAK